MGFFDWLKKFRGISVYDEKREKLSRRISELIHFRKQKENDLSKTKHNNQETPSFNISRLEIKDIQPFTPNPIVVKLSMVELQNKRIQDFERKKEEYKKRIKVLSNSFEKAIESKDVEKATDLLNSLLPLINFVNEDNFVNEISKKKQSLKLLKEELLQREIERKRIEEELRKKEEEERQEAERKRKEKLEIERLERERRAKEFEERKLQEERKLIDERNRLRNLTTRSKSDASRFINYLKEKGVTCFYHFTDRENLHSIRKYGGLYSWSYCETNGIKIPNAGGDNQSRILDRRHGIEDYVRLSFCDDHPMAYRLQKDGASLVLLKIKLEVAGFLETQFSDINAADNNVSHGTEFEHLRNVNIAATKRRYVSRNDPDFKEHQAECMIKTFLPIEYIINIDNPQSL